MGYNDDSLDVLKGLTLESVTGEAGDDEMLMKSTDGRTFRFWHDQDCCESVRIEDVCGDLQDLIGSPIVMAEEVSSDDAPPPPNPDSYTWTFYKFATVKGYVTVRWLGESNGFYGEEVSFKEVE